MVKLVDGTEVIATDSSSRTSRSRKGFACGDRVFGFFHPIEPDHFLIWFKLHPTNHMDIEIVTVPAKPRSYYHHSLWIKGGQGWPWVAASGLEALESVTIKGLRPGKYRVQLTFANPTDDKRNYSIRLQDRVVEQAFVAGAKMIAVTRFFSGIKSDGSIKLDLVAQTGSTQLSGIEVVSMEP